MPPQRRHVICRFWAQNGGPTPSLDKHDFAALPKCQLRDRIRMRMAIRNVRAQTIEAIARPAHRPTGDGRDKERSSPSVATQNGATAHGFGARPSMPAKKVTAGARWHGD